ncbi:MAG TPA: aminoacetone oxidase family FAD-binding enzyme, partial [Methanomicrobiales archaeon]|nr:aminoacetone oxidase family FAD-binding enzyme [Methanomicrobiales archaeon]
MIVPGEFGTGERRVKAHDVVVVGGGPAGLFCALQAAGEDRSVLLLEKNPSCGRKLLITGSGQCNLTHDGDIGEFPAHYGDHGAFLRSALMAFTNRDLIAFFEERGLPMDVEGESGKVFPATRRASDILALLLLACNERGVTIRFSEPVEHVSVKEGVFTIKTPVAVYTAKCLVIAAGGSSYPAMGSTGDGYALARELGLSVTPTAPALVPVYVKEYPFADLAGISFPDIPISLFRGGKKVQQKSGDLLFTHSGLSGPGILDLSRYIAAGDVLKVAFLRGTAPE